MTSQPLICLAPSHAELVGEAVGSLDQALGELFGLRADIGRDPRPAGAPRFIIGKISDAHVRRAVEQPPALSDQGYLLRRTSPDTLIVAGGSDAATCWAVFH